MNKFKLSLVLIIAVLLVSTTYCQAFISKPIDQIPGVVMPTVNTSVPTFTPVPFQAAPQNTPFALTPTTLPSPIFIDVTNQTDVTGASGTKKDSSITISLIILIIGLIGVVGGLLYYYKIRR